MSWESAKLAASKASREDVKSYAQKLVHDHSDYNAELEKLGKEQGATLPTEPDAADQARMAELEKASGKAFDALYVKDALRINADDKKAAEKEKSETKNPAIKAFIAKFAGHGRRAREAGETARSFEQLISAAAAAAAATHAAARSRWALVGGRTA